MKIYPKLYKRASDGSTQVWWMEQDGHRYRSHSGKDGGAITTTRWTTTVPKNLGRANETTAEEQATKEVEAEYTLKKKRHYRETKDDAHSHAQKTFKPMLARKYQDEEERYWEDKRAKFAQPKLDGVRCLVTSKGMFARTGAKIETAPHILEALHGSEWYDYHPKLVLDGELYNHTFASDFNALISAIKRTPDEESIAKSRKIVQYHVFDCYDPDLPLMTFSDRYELVSGVVRSCPDSVVKVRTEPLLTPKDADVFYDSVLQDGYEGMMLRLDAPYAPDKRSPCLLKRKTMMDEEFKVLDILPGRGNAETLAKIAVVELGNGKTAKADIVGTRDELTRLLDRRRYLIGKMATVTFQGYTPDKSIRFPKLKIIHITARW